MPLGEISFLRKFLLIKQMVLVSISGGGEEYIKNDGMELKGLKNTKYD